jgi:hypothetical protein
MRHIVFTIKMMLDEEREPQEVLEQIRSDLSKALDPVRPGEELDVEYTFSELTRRAAL